jgi:hypothetical protein
MNKKENNININTSVISAKDDTVEDSNVNNNNVNKKSVTNKDATEDIVDQPSTVTTDGAVTTKKGYSKNGKKLGRPSKNSIEKAKKTKNPVGRPPGDKSVIAEYKARMLASPKSKKVLDAVLEAASDPDHKNFTAAAKLVMDRLLPVSAFEEAKSGSGKVSVNISIANSDGTTTVVGESSEEDAIDAEYEEVTNE